MIRRLVLALLPLAGFALGAAFAATGGWLAAATAVGCLALAVAAAALAAPAADRPGGPRGAARRPAIPRSTRPTSREDLPTLSGYWRAHDEPDWPEGEVRRERQREDEPVASQR